MFFSYWFTLIFLGLGSSQNMISNGISNGISKLNFAVDGTNNILKLIMAVEAFTNNGFSIKESIPLNPPRIDYGITFEELRSLFKHSMVSKCTPAQLKNGKCFCEGKFQEVKLFRNATVDSQASVAVDDTNKLVAISYRITVSETNWQSNYKSTLSRHPYVNGPAMVHDGHLEYVDSLYRLMEPTVVEMLKRHPTYKLHITGYSLGGSVAIISLPFWTNTLKTKKLANKAQVFSYSGPRPGNAEFAKYVETLGVPIVRYALKGDVIPHVSDQAMGYSQAGLEFYDSSIPVLRNSVVKCSLNVIEDSNCGMKDVNFYAPLHVTPFQRPAPFPPLC
ncbi:hypothetical protein DSO57_1001248 [Entomophthora muscae]|uniref:Uncharacterized protein n=1 Tax=Entomophthora muscae TaxID=34485 RepID=A0ACC2SM31_9FUNG|nr:hypothetical protein DSO57_1001248 [Entomophthora muscae]